MQYHDFESDDFRDQLESDLIYLCTFGLDDPLRVNTEANGEIVTVKDSI